MNDVRQFSEKHATTFCSVAGRAHVRCARELWGADRIPTRRDDRGPGESAGRVPDLLVTSPSVSDTGLQPGGRFTLSATVRNAGDGAAEATTLRYFRSAAPAITRSDTEVGNDQVRAHAASRSGTESVDLTAPTTAGTYYYGACVDAVAGESDTTNNCSTGAQVTVHATVSKRAERRTSR